MVSIIESSIFNLGLEQESFTNKGKGHVLSFRCNKTVDLSLLHCQSIDLDKDRDHLACASVACSVVRA